MLLENKDLAYLVGSYQSDGYYYNFQNKKRNRVETRFGILGNRKSLPMIKRFQISLRKNFNRNVKIEKVRNRDVYTLRTTINKLTGTFECIGLLDKNFAAQNWILSKTGLFGAFLAGLIDGDGSISIKRPKYPQCVIKIWDGTPPLELKGQIEKIMKCKARIYLVKNETIIKGRRVKGEGYYLEFYVSSKNLEFIEKYVYPEMQIKHKRCELEEFFKIKNTNN